MTKKIFACLSLVLIFTLTIFSAAEAKSQAELTNISAYELDDKTLRVEIDFKGHLNDQDFLLRAAGKNLIVDMYSTTPGRISKISGKKVASADVEKVSVGEFRVNQTRINFTLNFPVDENDVNFNVEPATKKSPAKILIDIPKAYAASDDENFDASDKVIVIDAGHGGSDRGAVGPRGVTEKSVTLAVALKAEKLLTDSGAKVVMTRRTDIDVASPSASDAQELQARVNKTPPTADIFISIHCNAFTNPNTSGMETFYFSGSPQSRRLAQYLNEELLKYGGRANRGVKSANFYVLKHAKCPASLIELAFVTNPTEESLLADDDYQNELARAIASAVKKYFND